MILLILQYAGIKIPLWSVSHLLKYLWFCHSFINLFLNRAHFFSRSFLLPYVPPTRPNHTRKPWWLWIQFARRWKAKARWNFTCKSTAFSRSRAKFSLYPVGEREMSSVLFLLLPYRLQIQSDRTRAVIRSGFIFVFSLPYQSTSLGMDRTPIHVSVCPFQNQLQTTQRIWCHLIGGNLRSWYKITSTSNNTNRMATRKYWLRKEHGHCLVVHPAPNVSSFFSFFLAGPSLVWAKEW